MLRNLDLDRKFAELVAAIRRDIDGADDRDLSMAWWNQGLADPTNRKTKTAPNRLQCRTKVVI
ncbi:MAG: hypothetical protein RIC14_02415 [Filomicrobium sp.]